jgi:putative membrane protein
MGDIVLTIIHHLCVFAIVAMLGAEFAVMRAGVTPAAIRLLRRLDAIYGGAAVLVLLAGFGRVFHNGSGFYFANPVFWTKIGLFVIVGILSIRPTIAFMRWHKALAADPGFVAPANEVKSVRTMLHAQLGFLFLIPIAAALMAKGIGL